MTVRFALISSWVCEDAQVRALTTAVLVLLTLRDGALQSSAGDGKGAAKVSYLSSPTSLGWREAEGTAWF